MYITAIVLIILGLALAGYGHHIDRSENYAAILPFFGGLALAAIGLLVALAKWLFSLAGWM
ncbi:hypothetical protein [Mariprofundus ferrooxydans]|uniref:hypothetical protein n=1 Tax=Mariprofundus ferrooxydans TaxID=314344 RepID=UPI0014312FE2|nr:hypothetical protein [Mariprofundus ferrooxydans]